MEMMTVSPGDDKGGRPCKGEETGATVAPVSEPTMSDRKEKNLRAILRAPELIQSLYRDGLVSQGAAVITVINSSRPRPNRNIVPIATSPVGIA
jgi:hypothetical protein